MIRDLLPHTIWLYTKSQSKNQKSKIDNHQIPTLPPPSALPYSPKKKHSHSLAPLLFQHQLNATFPPPRTGVKAFHCLTTLSVPKLSPAQLVRHLPTMQHNATSSR